MKSKGYYKEIESDKVFEFGKLIGCGSDDDHFQCGVTSRKLLNRIKEFNNRGVYHLDATYKIIKQFFV